MTLQEKINQLEEEAQANLTLYTNGQDDSAYNRYVMIMATVRVMKEKLYQN